MRHDRREREAVSAILFGGGVVDFVWRDPYNDPRDVYACGFLRGNEFFFHINDEDNQINVVCEVNQCQGTSTFYIGEVFGYHLGLCDTEGIDSFMLKCDADVRAGRLDSVDGPEWGVLSTRMDCVHVISAMLRTLQLGWKVRFSKRREGEIGHATTCMSKLSAGTSEELYSHIVALRTNA